MAGSDIRTEKLEEIYSLCRAYTLAHSKSLENLEVDPQDFVQDVVTNIFRRKGLDNYDPEKLQGRPFESLIWRICKNELIDISRAKYERKTRLDPSGNPYKVVSLDEDLANREGDTFTRHEMEAAPLETRTLVIELMHLTPETQISPNYNLSWRELFLMSHSMSVTEIAEKVGISTSRISQLQVEMGMKFLFKNGRDGSSGFKDEPDQTQGPKKPLSKEVSAD